MDDLRGQRGTILTQVPSHQVGIVEVLHSQSNNVDEFLYDLHELHRSRIDLNTKAHIQLFNLTWQTLTMCVKQSVC